jgi:hypothetical protein
VSASLFAASSFGKHETSILAFVSRYDCFLRFASTVCCDVLHMHDDDAGEKKEAEKSFSPLSRAW